MGRGQTEILDPFELDRSFDGGSASSEAIEKRISMIDWATDRLDKAQLTEPREAALQLLKENGASLLSDQEPLVCEALDRTLRSYARYNIRFNRFGVEETGDYISHLLAKLRLLDWRSPQLLFAADEKPLRVHVRASDSSTVCGLSAADMHSASLRVLRGGKRICPTCAVKAATELKELAGSAPQAPTVLSEQYLQRFPALARARLAELPQDGGGGIAVERGGPTIAMALAASGSALLREIVASYAGELLWSLEPQQRFDLLFNPVGNWQPGFHPEIDELAAEVRVQCGPPQAIEWTSASFLSGLFRRMLDKISDISIEGHHDDRFVAAFLAGSFFCDAAESIYEGKGTEAYRYFAPLWRKHYRREMALEIRQRKVSGHVTAFGPGGVRQLPLNSIARAAAVKP